MSTLESQQPKPGWEWYQPTTASGLGASHQRSAEGGRGREMVRRDDGEVTGQGLEGALAVVLILDE